MSLSPEALADALRPVVLRLSRHIRREAQRLGASALDAQLLAYLKRNPGVGVSELAEREQISKAAMSAHVKRLEEAGWVAREEDDPDDRRRVGLFVTKAGRKALDDIRKLRNDWLAARLSELSASERAWLAAALGPLNQLAGEA
jgi:DNA-binding MarR family transcriptional regulator